MPTGILTALLPQALMPSEQQTRAETDLQGELQPWRLAKKRTLSRL